MNSSQPRCPSQWWNFSQMSNFAVTHKKYIFSLISVWSQCNFVYIKAIVLSWSVQNFIVIWLDFFKLWLIKFTSDLDFSWSAVIGTNVVSCHVKNIPYITSCVEKCLHYALFNLFLLRYCVISFQVRVNILHWWAWQTGKGHITETYICI